jgi:small subunit ribosomal protein S5
MTAMNDRIQVPVPRGEFEERLISIDRVSRTVKGGKRMRFRALVVVGDRNGRVGCGLGKGNEVPLAVAKATTRAKKSLVVVPRHGSTIRHAVSAKYGATTVLLWPASDGTSVIAGGAVRSVVELAGIQNILGKLHGSTNKTNAIRATLTALGQLGAGTDHGQPAAAPQSSGDTQSVAHDEPKEAA